MSEKAPHFKIAHVYVDGTDGPAEIIPVTDLPWNTKMGRRDLFAAGAAVAAVVGAISQGTPVSADTGPKRDAKDVYAHLGPVQSLAMSSDGNILLSASGDETCKAWKLPEGALFKSQVNPSPQVNAILGLNANDLSVIRVALPNPADPIGAYQLTVIYQKLSSWKEKELADSPPKVLAEIERPGTITTLAATPDGQNLIIGRVSGVIEVHKMDDGSLIKTLSGHSDAITGLALSAMGSNLVSASKDGAVKVWSVSDGSVLHTIACPSASGVAIASDLKIVAVSSSSHDPEIRMFRLPDGRMVKKFKAQKAGVTAVAIAGDGELLATGSSDGSIWLWEIPRARRLAQLMDLRASQPAAHGITYTVTSESGRLITYTLPCGSPIPSGAVCTCNCVPGSFVVAHDPPSRRTDPPTTYTPATCSCVSVSVCTCNSVCVCLPVCVCLAVR